MTTMLVALAILLVVVGPLHNEWRLWRLRRLEGNVRRLEEARRREWALRRFHERQRDLRRDMQRRDS